MNTLRVLAISFIWFSAAAASAPQLLILTENSPPYQYISNEKVHGIATERVQEIIDKAGLSATYEVYPWARALRKAQQTSQALIYSIAKTPRRAETFTWIAPVAAFKLGLLTLKGVAPQRFTLPLDTSVLAVATQRDDIAAEWLLEQGFVEGDNLILCADIVCSWQQLKLGTVDFIIEDPNLIEATAGLVGLTATEVTLQRVVPELSVTGYLAANKAMDAEVVAQLRQAAKELGYHNDGSHP